MNQHGEAIFSLMNSLEQNIIISILEYLSLGELNSLAGLVYSSDSKEIQDEFYNEEVMNDNSIGKCLMIYSWHDRLWKSHVLKRINNINEVLVNNNTNLKIELEAIRENYRFRFIQEIWKRIKNWDLFQQKRRERISYINEINAKITTIANTKGLYKNTKCEKIIRTRIGQKFYIEESSIELPLKDILYLDKNKNKFKWVSIGSSSVGKTCLLMRVVYDSYDYPFPTVFENYSKPETIPCTQDGIEFESGFISNIWDTAGQEEYDKLRPLFYPKTKLFTMEYAINDMSTLKYLVEHLMWECSQCTPQATFVVVSTKNDLKFGLYWNSLFDPSNVMEPISKEEGIQFSKAIGAVSFIETSAKTGEGTRDLHKRLALIRHFHLKHLGSYELDKMQTEKKCNLQ